MATCRYICGVYTHEEPQEPPERTSERVKSEIFLGACSQTPLTQSILWAPLFVLALGLPNPLSGPGLTKQGFQGLVVGFNGKVSAEKVMMKLLHREDDGQSFFL